MRSATRMMLWVLLLVLPSSTFAEQHAKVLLILDSSGSMWGQIDGRAKTTIAKEALAGIIDTMPAGFDTGLMAYGHRRKGDCKDIELLIPPGPHDPKAMKAKVAELSAKGKTPLSDSLRMAAQTLRSTEEAASVILITDGLETCDADPCQVAADLAMSGVGFTVHVIGFDLSQADQDRVRCIADKTGGLFVAANDAAALKTALVKTVTKVNQPPPPVVADPGTATLEAVQQVAVGDTFAVKWQGPNSRSDYICLVTPDPKDSRCLDHGYTEQGNPVKLAAKCDAGSFELRYIHGHTGKVLGKRALTVLPAQVDLTAPAEAVAATPVTITWKGPGYPTDYIAIASPEPPDHGYTAYTYTREGNTLKVQAPSLPGSYEVRYYLGAGDKVLGRTKIKITEATATVKAPEKADAASAFMVDWQGPGNRGDYISIARPDDQDGYDNYAYTSTGNPAQLNAPSQPGTWEVRYVLGQDDVILARTSIEISGVSAQVQPPAEADVAGEIAVQWQGPDSKGDYISIAKTDDQHGYFNYAYTKAGSPAKLTAPSAAGTYEVRYVLGQDNVILARQPITVKPVTAQLQAPGEAAVASSFSVQWQGPNGKGDYISIARGDASGGEYLNYAYTRNGNPAKLTAASTPGTYEVRYILGLDNVILARQQIVIGAVTAAITAPAEVEAAAKFKVEWQGPGNNGDYISVAKSDDGGGGYLNYAYTTSGSPVELLAPSPPGTYEVRYIQHLDNVILARQQLVVKGVTATLQAPASAPMGSAIEVQWQGPARDGDYISIARPEDDGGGYLYYQYTTEGSPVKLQLPTAAGNYEIRYILAPDNMILARQAIAVDQVPAAVAGPSSARPAEDITVSWQGPNAPSDYISIASPESDGSSYLTYEYTGKGNPVQVRTPEEPGEYEIRYIAAEHGEILARTRLKIE